jgi:hypothetical protein
VLALLVLIPNATAVAPCMSIACEPDPYDGTVMSVTITSPGNYETVSGTVAIQIKLNGTKAQNVNRVEFYFDNILFATDTNAPFKADWNTLDPSIPAYDNSVHYLTAIS